MKAKGSRNNSPTNSVNMMTPEQKEAAMATNIDQELLIRLDSLRKKEAAAAAAAAPAAAKTSAPQKDKVKAASGINEGFAAFMANPHLQKLSQPSMADDKKAKSTSDKELKSKVSSRAVATGVVASKSKSDHPSDFNTQLQKKVQEAPKTPSEQVVEEDHEPLTSPQVDNALDSLMDTMNDTMKNDAMNAMDDEGYRSEDTPPPALEDELMSGLSILKKKKAQREAKAAAAYAKTREEVASLVRETQPGTDVDKLLAKYKGKEDDLISSLKQQKARKHLKGTKREIV
jgi:hypothetical protein